MDNDGNLLASPGMLMGMHNAASTTLALAATGFQLPAGCRVITFRSSDDSMSVFIAPDGFSLVKNIELDRKSLKLIGVNLSKDKTFIFPYQYGEYTSWYQDVHFVAQYGVETAQLRPQGKKPARRLSLCVQGMPSGRKQFGCQSHRRRVLVESGGFQC